MIVALVLYCMVVNGSGYLYHCLICLSGCVLVLFYFLCVRKFLKTIFYCMEKVNSFESFGLCLGLCGFHLCNSYLVISFLYFVKMYFLCGVKSIFIESIIFKIFLFSVKLFFSIVFSKTFCKLPSPR